MALALMELCSIEQSSNASREARGASAGNARVPKTKTRGVLTLVILVDVMLGASQVYDPSEDEVQLALLEGAPKAPERGALALEMLVVHSSRRLESSKHYISLLH